MVDLQGKYIAGGETVDGRRGWREEMGRDAEEQMVDGKEGRI